MPATVQPQCMIKESHWGQQAGRDGGMMLQASIMYRCSGGIQPGTGAKGCCTGQNTGEKDSSLKVKKVMEKGFTKTSTLKLLCMMSVQ